MRFAALRRGSSRVDWLGSRGVGASDVAAILGLSPYRTPFEAWAAITRRVVSIQTPAMTRGHRWEPHVLALYQAETGGDVRRPPPWSTYAHPDHPWATASPDAFRLDEGPGLVEAKTDAVGRWGPSCEIDRWTAEAAKLVRADYFVQCQWQAWVLDAPWVDLVVLLPFYELRIYRLHRDPFLLAGIVGVVSAWRDRFVVASSGGEVPPVDGSETASTVLALGLAPVTREDLATRTATTAEVELAIAYERARVASNEAEVERRRIGQLLVQSAAGAGRLDLAGVGHVSVVRQPERRYLDERALLAERPELREVLDRFRRSGQAPSVYPRVYGINRP